MAEQAKFYWAVVGDGNPEPVAVTGEAGARKVFTIGCPDPFMIDEAGCPCRLLPGYDEGVTDNTYNGKLVLTGDMPPLTPPRNLLDKKVRAGLEKAFKDRRAPRHSYADSGDRPMAEQNGERGQIVAWLREKAEALETTRALSALRWADAIERGDHISTPAPSSLAEQAKRVLKAFNGGMVDVPDAANSRGYTTQYLPIEAMCAALASTVPPSLAEQNAALVEALERVAKMVEKRRDDRFAEYGMTDPDTNASHYPGHYGETREALDEECEEIAMAIRATIRKEPLDG